MSLFGPHDHAIRTARVARTRLDASIYLETSQAGQMDILTAIQTLGSDAVLFGTDGPYYGADHYRRSKRLLQTLRTRLNTQDYFRVTAGNAIRIFSLANFALKTLVNSDYLHTYEFPLTIRTI